jgi:hypothetical protein
MTALDPGGNHFSSLTVRSAAMAIPDFFAGAEGAPRRIGLPDVERLEADTHALRMLDYRQGGDACPSAVRSRTGDGRLMLDASAAEYVRRRLHVALGDLHNLAGWVCFDVGLAGSARVHFAQALVLAGRGRNNGLAELDRGRRQFAAADRTDVPSWAAFFTETDLSAVTGAVHTDLAQTMNHGHTRTAIPLRTEAVDDYGAGMARSRAFSLILLSINHLVDRDVDRGVAVGLRALAAAEPLGSARVRDRIRPLGRQAERYRSHSSSPPASPITPVHPCDDIDTSRRRSAVRRPAMVGGV